MLFSGMCISLRHKTTEVSYYLIYMITIKKSMNLVVGVIASLKIQIKMFYPYKLKGIRVKLLTLFWKLFWPS